MKWVTFISCLFLVSFAESKHLPRRYRDVEHDTISRASDLSPVEFKAVSLVLYSQLMQKATLEEVKKLVHDVEEVAKKCAADAQSDPDCAKSLRTLFLEEICHEQGLAEKYGFTECCGKAGEERKDCFLSHKNASRGFIPPFQQPSVEEGCTAYHDNKDHVLEEYIYEVARRNPLGMVAVIVNAAHDYDDVLETCCKAEDKNACFGEKATAVTRQLKEAFGVQKQTCSILKKFGTKHILAIKLAQLSQKFPKADLPTLSKIAHDVEHVHEECCKGDTLECLLDRKHVTEYVCSHQDTISTKVKGCCEKPLLERGQCLVHVENDDKPADLSPTVREFIEDKEVCQHYTQDKEAHLSNFLYQYARRHRELSVQLLLRLTQGYENLLEKCCPTEHPETCLAEGEQQLKKHIAESLAVVKQNCEMFSRLGNYLFENEILMRYVKKAPQLTFEELKKFSEKLTSVAGKCCGLDEAHILPCAEGYTDLVLGAICRRHEEHHINKQVCDCCSGPYAFRRECFSGLGIDPEYVPPPFDPALFTFHADLCTANQADLEKKKQRLLVNMYKQKLNISDEQLVEVIVKFTTMKTECCEESDHEQCFTAKGPKLVEDIRTAFGVN
ncbi:alpha-fetoprotein-like [Elgaria multicarinata webbii]|uniref:alpha-fetoprotein-like n=1 Tax=Elgaria multicarinata webbii TaxID=159646 RepID=UPI002FCCF4B9